MCWLDKKRRKKHVYLHELLKLTHWLQRICHKIVSHLKTMEKYAAKSHTVLWGSISLQFLNYWSFQLLFHNSLNLVKVWIGQMQDYFGVWRTWTLSGFLEVCGGAGIGMLVRMSCFWFFLQISHETRERTWSENSCVLLHPLVWTGKQGGPW